MRTLAWLAVSFAGAIFLSVYLLQAVGVLVAGGICLLCTVFAAILRRRGRAFILISLIMTGLSAGFLWYCVYSNLVYNRVAALDEMQVACTVTVAGFAEEGTYRDHVDVFLENLSPLPVRVRLYADDLTDLTPGDVLDMQARCVLADQYKGEQTDRFTSQGVFAFLYAEDGFTIEKDSGFTIRWTAQYLAHMLRERIYALFPESTVGIFLAILAGDSSEIYANPALLSSFRIAGVYHILVVSGMHLSFLTGVLTALFGRKKWTIVLILPVLVLFAAMVGFTPSVSRALVMQLFVLFANLFERENDRLTALAVALALLLLQNPYAAAGVGLQLSFAATLGILLFADRIYAALFEKCKDRRICACKIVRRFLSSMVSLFAASVGANLLTVPLVALYYGNISLIAPITNLLTMWAFSFAFSIGLFACLVGWIWVPAGTVIAWCASVFILFAKYAVELLAKTPVAAVYTSNVYTMIWLIYVYALVLLYLVYGKTRRLLLPLSLASVSLCVMLVASVLENRSSALRVTAIDVGQGQCLLLSSNDASVMIDCGSSSISNAGAVAAEYL